MGPVFLGSLKGFALSNVSVQGCDLGTYQAHPSGLPCPRPDLWVLTRPVVTRLTFSQTSPRHKKKQPQQRDQVVPALMLSHTAAIVRVSSTHKNMMVVFFFIV